MSLPANENTTAVYDWRVVKIVTPETIPFEATEDHKLHDLVFISQDDLGFVGACEEAVAVEEEGSADIHDGMEMQTDHLSLDPLVNGFATPYMEVWVDPVTYLAQDTYVAGLRGVGKLTLNGTKDANGVIQFKKRKYWINEPETPST